MQGVRGSRVLGLWVWFCCCFLVFGGVGSLLPSEVGAPAECIGFRVQGLRFRVTCQSFGGLGALGLGRMDFRFRGLISRVGVYEGYIPNPHRVPPSFSLAKEGSQILGGERRHLTALQP